MQDMARLRISPAQAWRDFLYVGAALPLGIAWLLSLGLGLALGVGLLIVTIGIPILGITLLVWKAGANLERRRAALVQARNPALPAKGSQKRRFLPSTRHGRSLLGKCRRNALMP